MEESPLVRMSGNGRRPACRTGGQPPFRTQETAMTRPALPSAAALCAAALLAVAPPAASAADIAAKPTASPDRPRPRTGAYKVTRRGAHLIRARCLEGGHVLVPTHEKATAAQRERDIHQACKTVDYTR
jgi:hypothetical protein